MIIQTVDTFRVTAGWRDWLLLRVRAKDGGEGWADCTDANGSLAGLRATIHDLSERIIGRDAGPIELIVDDLYRGTRQSAGGLVQKAIAAYENAFLDLKARWLGISVAALLGGPTRTRIPLYWSHCATTRLRHANLLGGARPVQSLADAGAVAAEARAQGYVGIKTNLLMFPASGRPYVVGNGFQGGEGSGDRNVTPEMVRGTVALMEAMRKGLGPDRELILDINMHLRADGAARIASALAPFDIAWLEVDIDDPVELAHLRARAPMPIGSCEKRQLMEGYRPFLEAHALDVVIADPRWTGVLQSKKIADLAKAHDLNLAPHNHGSPLATLMAAHLCSAITNLRLLEFDADDVPWRDSLLSQPLTISGGHIVLPDGPGWGAQINETVLREHERRA